MALWKTVIRPPICASTFVKIIIMLQFCVIFMCCSYTVKISNHFLTNNKVQWLDKISYAESGNIVLHKHANDIYRYYYPWISHREDILEIIIGVSPSTSWKQSSLAQCTTGGKLNVELKWFRFNWIQNNSMNHQIKSSFSQGFIKLMPFCFSMLKLSDQNVLYSLELWSHVKVLEWLL